MSNKIKLFIVLGIIVIIISSFITGLLIGKKNTQKPNSQISKEDNSIPLQIEIQETIGAKSENEIKKYVLNQEEIYVFFNIINNLTFSDKICAGLPTHIIIYNNNEKGDFVGYPIETYGNEYHIPFR